MRHITGLYTQQFNRKHGTAGPLLNEIDKPFGIRNYSSVSSMIKGTQQRLKTDRNFKKRIDDLYRLIINSQEQT
jgi:hypothetical protein